MKEDKKSRNVEAAVVLVILVLEGVGKVYLVVGEKDTQAAPRSRA